MNQPSRFIGNKLSTNTKFQAGEFKDAKKMVLVR